MSFVDITHPDDVRADVDLAEQLFKREIPFYRIQKRYVKKTGEIIWINLTKSIILRANGVAGALSCTSIPLRASVDSG